MCPGKGVEMSVDQVAERRSARRVLVVDDHPSFRKSASALLTAEGFDVVGQAADGASAVALAAELEPELVLLDIQLPDLDGFAVAKRLLADAPGLLIVLVSSRDRSSYGSLIEGSGAHAFLAKGDLSGATLARVLG
jgi:DNA-binding NarL/FixJ family response regulator